MKKRFSMQRVKECFFCAGVKYVRAASEEASAQSRMRKALTKETTKESENDECVFRRAREEVRRYYSRWRFVRAREEVFECSLHAFTTATFLYTMQR